MTSGSLSTYTFIRCLIKPCFYLVFTTHCIHKYIRTFKFAPNQHAWRHGTAEDTGRRRPEGRRRRVDLWRRGKLAPGGAGIDLGEEARSDGGARNREEVAARALIGPGRVGDASARCRKLKIFFLNV